MEIKELIGSKQKVKIIELSENKKYYLSETLDNNQKVYIENDGDYEPEELIGRIEECLIINVLEDKLVGFLMTNRKFENDLKRIENKLKETDEYDSIKDIYLMERLKIKGKVVGLYMVDEGEIGKYYLDTVEIGTFSKKIKENNIIFKDRKIEDEIGKQIRDVVLSIDLAKKEISLRAEEEAQMDLIRKALGLPEREILRIATISLNQKVQVEDKENEKYDKIAENNSKELRKRAEIELENMKYRPEEFKTKNDINIKQELKLNSKITDMKTLGQVLEKNNKLPQVEGKKFIKMGVIESNHRDDLVDINGKYAKENSTRYSFVAIATDGTVIPLDLNQDRQEQRNPTEHNYQINQKGEVEQDDVCSRFNIGNGTFAIKNGKYGEIKVYHSPRKTLGGQGIEGNRSLDVELETNNVWNMRKQQRDIASEYKTGYRSVERSYNEAKQHENEKGEILEEDINRLRTEDIDGNKNTKSHTHEEEKKKQKNNKDERER